MNAALWPWPFRRLDRRSIHPISRTEGHCCGCGKYRFPFEVNRDRYRDPPQFVTACVRDLTEIVAEASLDHERQELCVEAKAQTTGSTFWSINDECVRPG